MKQKYKPAATVALVSQPFAWRNQASTLRMVKKLKSAEICQFFDRSVSDALRVKRDKRALETQITEIGSLFASVE